MVAICRALTVLSLASAVSAAVAGRHAKRLFGLHWDTTSVVPTPVPTKALGVVTKVATATVTSTAAAQATSTSTLGTNIYTDLTAIPDGDRIAIWTLSSLNAQECHDLCAASSTCVFYNVYTSSSSYFHGSTPYCAIYSAEKTAADATDAGSSAGLTYSSSDGYSMSAVTSTDTDSQSDSTTDSDTDIDSSSGTTASSAHMS